MRRKRIAKHEGLGDDYDVGTYPSEGDIRFGPSLLTKLALGAALLGSGAAIPMGLSFLESMKDKQPTAAVDMDTQYEFGLE